MKSLRLLVFLVAAFFGLVNVQATEFAKLSEANQLLWLKQLYLNNEALQATQPYLARVHSHSFYLQPVTDGVVDPVLEFNLSVANLITDITYIDDDHAICRFPARFLFLNSVLNAGYSTSLLESCSSFLKWSRYSEYDTLSLVMVEGYYGNPASSFGHLVVRHGRADRKQQLLDTTLNYGAKVPENEPMPVYIIRGLLGGYQAGFTVENYYKQDLVYSQTEYRDMWRYDLALDDYQRLFFLAHVWELMGNPTTYYFLKNNCAYAVAEVLEIVLGVELVNQKTLWYPPVSLFHELAKQHAASSVDLISERQFIPSEKRVLKALYKQLSEQQIALVNRYLKEDVEDLSKWLDGLSEVEAAQTIEALIRLVDYQIVGYPEIGTDLYKRRQQLIVARLQYPGGRFLKNVDIEPTLPPDESNRVSRIGVGYAHVGGEAGAVFSFTPALYLGGELGAVVTRDLLAIVGADVNVVTGQAGVGADVRYTLSPELSVQWRWQQKDVLHSGIEGVNAEVKVNWHFR